MSAHVTNEEHDRNELFYEIVDQDDDWVNRGYKEAIAIKNLKPNLNEDEGRVYIPHIYDQIFRTSEYKNQSARQNTPEFEFLLNSEDDSVATSRIYSKRQK